jgi:hypothetical protein
MVEALRCDRSVGLITADEQIVEGDEYWGPNRGRTAELCARIGIDISKYPLRFASGSIFWLHPRRWHRSAEAGNRRRSTLIRRSTMHRRLIRRGHGDSAQFPNTSFVDSAAFGDRFG